MGYKAVVLDMDGVVWRGKTVIEGAAEAIERMKAMGADVFYLTNNSTKTRGSNVDKLAGMGIPAKEKDIYTSGLAAVRYLRENFGKGSVYVVGSDDLKRWFEAEGFGVREDENVDFAVVGLDRQISYERIGKAMNAIKENGAKFIATNDDATFPMENGELPGAGVMVASVETAAGKKPDVVLGKPNTYLLEMIAKDCGCSPEEMIIVGDRLETDIACGNRFGANTACVLTGNATREMAENAEGESRPKKILESIREVPSLLEKE